MTLTTRAGKGSALTAAEHDGNMTHLSDGANIKAEYEGEADTNAFTDAKLAEVALNTGKNTYPSADAAKLAGVSDNAEVNRSIEQLQDIIAAMFQAGTHTNLTVTYDDAAGTISLAASGGGGATLTQEEVEDFVAGLSTAGTGINVSYDDTGNILTFALSGESFTTAHKATVDLLTVTKPVDLDRAVIQIAAGFDASAGTFPATSRAGDSHKVTTAGTIDGVYFEVGSRLIAIVHDASTTTFAANWEKSLTSGVTTPSGTPVLTDQVPQFKNSDGSTFLSAWSAILVAFNVLRSSVTANLTAAFTTTSRDRGTTAIGDTRTIDFVGSNTQHLINGGAFTLAPPTSGEGTIELLVSNNATAGVATVSGFDNIIGTFDTTDGNLFWCTVSRIKAQTRLAISPDSRNT